MITSLLVKKKRWICVLLVCLLIVFILTNLFLINENFFTRVSNSILQNEHQTTIQPTTVVEDPSKQIQQIETVVLLFWSTIWGRPAKNSVGVWKMGSESGQCPVPCEVTIDRSRINEAKAFIVHSTDANPLPPSKHVPWILFGQENPLYAPALTNSDFMSQFHILRSYRLDSDFPNPNFMKPSLDSPVAFENKTGGIMAVFSNCEKVRTAYLGQLMKHIKVDSYGGCLHNKEGLTKRYIGEYRQVKQALARSYKFLLVFFNQDCDYFVDEQLSHALDSGAVPVVMSTDKIYEFLPGNLKNAIVNVRDFKSPKDLADRLKFLMNNKTEYNKFLEWKVKGLGNVSNTRIGKYWEYKIELWCEICVAVSQGKWHKEGLKADICKARDFKDWGITPL